MGRPNTIAGMLHQTAAWIDLHQHDYNGTEVQDDLREIADWFTLYQEEDRRIYGLVFDNKAGSDD